MKPSDPAPQDCEATFAYAVRHSPYYRQRFAGASGMPSWHQIPTIDKQVLSERNMDFLCVPREEIVEIVTTSGTVGEPLTWMLTESDLRRLAQGERLGFEGLGLTRRDTVLLAVTLDRCFIAGLAYATGLRELGAACIRVGPSSPLLVLNSIERFQPVAIVAVPSFLNILAQKARELGLDLSRSSVRKAICIGEPIRHLNGSLNAAGQAIERTWAARAFSTYGVTELASACCECEAGNGAHIPTQFLYLEVLDDAGNALPEGTVGEVVATTLGVEGMPLLRYRTGDCAALTHLPCSCGRTTPRLGPVVGRKAQKLKIKGTSVFPLALQNILDDTAGVNTYAIVATSQADLSDAVEVLYEGEVGTETLREVFQARVKITPQVRRASREEIEMIQMPRDARKRQSFVDRRGKR